jgi:hypothetical protein
MPKTILVSPIDLCIVAVRAMAATTFTTISPFEEVLFGKDPIPFFRKVIIALFQGNVFFHAQHQFVL